MASNNEESLRTAELVVIDYSSLTGGSSPPMNLRDQIGKAFGSDGVGIVGIRNVPNFTSAKHDLLSLAYPLAHLPSEELQKLEDHESLYNAGL